MSAAAQSPIAISVVGLRAPWDEQPMSRATPQRTDEELVEAVARADEDALGELYDRFGKVAYGLAYKILQDAALAEDAVQEAFLQIWRGAGSYRPERAKASTWLLTFVHRRAVDLVRREQTRRTSPVVAEPQGSDPGADEAVVDALAPRDRPGRPAPAAGRAARADRARLLRGPHPVRARRTPRPAAGHDQEPHVRRPAALTRAAR